MIPIWKLSGRLGNQMFQFAYLHAQMRRGLIQDVYLQSEDYFKHYSDEIRAMYGQGIGKIDQVSIHVRRGDYVKNSFYVDLSETEYYQTAMALFPHDDFLVFSDDIEWCKQQEIFKNCEFSEGNDEVTDMNLMASCKAHIIANSSFSWWAAWLSGRKTIAPKAWYADGVVRTECPSEWTLV